MHDVFAHQSVIGFALGEVDEEDVKHLKNQLPAEVQSSFESEEKTGLAFFYIESAVQLVSADILIDRYADKEIKRSWRLDLVIDEGQFPLHLYICHWPSRMVEQADRERRTLGQLLAQRISNVRSSIGALPTVVIGDFNDEPFDESLTSSLLGSRDRRLVRRRDSLLYNPFRALLGERQSIQAESAGWIPPGTYYYASDQLTQWLTVDQALVSRELLGGTEWTLNESGPGIVTHPAVINAAGRLKVGFDHLPILVTLSKLAEKEHSP